MSGEENQALRAPVRAVVIGCGRVGSGWDEWAESGAPRTHAGCYQTSDLTELVGLCDVNPIRAADAGERRGVEPWADVDECLQEARPELVSVCTPPGQHLEVVRRCVEYGVPAVLCEKPLAGTLEDACAIARLAEDSATAVGVMHHRRWLKPFTVVAGETQEVVATYSGGLLNNGTHALDFVRHAVGEVGSLVESWPDFASTSDPDVEAVYRLADGGLLRLTRGDFAVEAVGDWGAFQLTDKGRRFYHMAPGNSGWTEHDIDYAHAKLRACEQLARIARGADEVPACTVHDGLRAVGLAYQALGRKEVAA